MFIRLCLILGCTLLWSAGRPEDAQARSTVVAHFAVQAVAGPDIEQTLPLYLHYFPGDGEAILSAEIACDPVQVQVKTARSALGAVQAVAPLIRVDYTGRPLGREQIDTLLVSLVPRRSPGQLHWQARIYSSGDPAGQPAHTAVFALGIQPPLRLELEIGPDRVFPREQTPLEVRVRSADSRLLEGIDWEWPEGLSASREYARTHWPSPLAEGAQAILEWQVRIGPQPPGPLRLRGRAWGPQVAGSPVEAVLEVAVAPLAQVRVVGADFLEVGAPGRLVYEWQNPGAEALDLAELRMEVPAAFSPVRPVNPPMPVEIQPGALLLRQIGSLAPGAVMRLELETTPRQPGPFPWPGAFRPATRSDFIAASGQTVVRVVYPPAEKPVERGAWPTDLELLSQALGQAVERELRDLPLPPATQVCLEPYEKGEKNWVIDDALLEALLRQGYRVTLKQQGAAAAALLHYRLADARVVYTPAGWNPFRARQRREAYGELYVHLEEADRRISWMRRIRAYLADEVPADQAEVLGAAALVKRTQVEAQHKLVERGLSASIIGGLFYIFFIP